MASLIEAIEAELENVRGVLSALPDKDRLVRLSYLELAGSAALIHNFYNGIETCLKLLSK